MSSAAFNPVEATIEQTLEALDTGRVTAVELVEWNLERAARIDRDGPQLNAIVVLNPHALDEARAARGARQVTQGRSRGDPSRSKIRTW